MEEVEIGHQIGHLLRGEFRNSCFGLGHLSKDRGPFIPHDRSNLSEAFIESLCLLAKIVCHLSTLTPDGMAFHAAL